jgi:hypothetical protein
MLYKLSAENNYIYLMELWLCGHEKYTFNTFSIVYILQRSGQLFR